VSADGSQDRSPDQSQGGDGSGPVGPGGRPPAGADLARQALARAKEDARAKASARGRGRRGGNRGAAGDEPAASPDAPRRARLPGIAPPGRDWAEPVRFGAAIDRLLAERGWRADATTASVLARWDVLVGAEIASRCQPVTLTDGELVVAAVSTAWATQLRLMSRDLLATLRRELGPDVVRRLLVRGPTAPNWGHGPLRAPGGRGPRDTYG
jgi:predicted nucleic acid-binding Zn ribbon protein